MNVETWTSRCRLRAQEAVLSVALIALGLSVDSIQGQSPSESPPQDAPPIARPASGLLGTGQNVPGFLDTNQGVTQQQIQSWIEDLQSEIYSARESASRKLSRHLDQAMPSVIEAAESPVGRESEQLLQFLGFLGSNALSPQGKAAHACLQRIAEDRTTRRAVLAQKVLEGIAIQMRELAAERLRVVGVACEDRYLSVLTRTREVKNALVIDARFLGDARDLELLRWMFDVEFVKLEGPLITRDVLASIVQLPKLRSLQLIDTPLTGPDISVLFDAPDLDLLEVLYTPLGDESIPILEQLPIFGDLQLFGTLLSAQGAKDVVERIDSANVFVGRGGFLGITCEPSSLIIREVIPNGPAQEAGIRTMDKLLRVDDVAISNFEELRRELAKSADGEKVMVEFERPLVSFRRGGNPGNGPGTPQLDAYAPLRVEVTLGRRPSEMSR